VTRVRSSDLYRGAIRGWRDERLRTGFHVERVSLYRRLVERFGSIAVVRHGDLIREVVNRLETEMGKERSA